MDIKKIEYIVNDLVSPFIKENYPLYVELLTKFGRYLDDNNYGKIIYLDDNLDPYTTFSELLTKFLDEYFAGIFNFEVYELIDKNAQRFIDLSERINGLKGTAKTFQVVLQSLIELTIATNSGNIEVDNLGDITIIESSIPENIFTYEIFSSSSNISYVEDLIDNIRPAGIKPIYNYNLVNVDPSTWTIIHDDAYTYDSATQIFTISPTSFFQMEFYLETGTQFQNKTYNYTFETELISGNYSELSGNILFDDGVFPEQASINSDGPHTLTKIFDSSSGGMLFLWATSNITNTIELKIKNIILKEVIY